MDEQAFLTLIRRIEQPQSIKRLILDNFYIRKIASTDYFQPLKWTPVNFSMLKI